MDQDIVWSFQCFMSVATFGAYDAMPDFFTHEQKIKGVAVGKGARRSTSKLVGHLEPLTVTKMSMAHGRSMDIISKAEVVETPLGLGEETMEGRMMLGADGVRRDDHACHRSSACKDPPAQSGDERVEGRRCHHASRLLDEFQKRRYKSRCETSMLLRSATRLHADGCQYS